MKKHFSQFFSCMLMMLMTLHAIAASNMAVCNSMMQVNVSSTQANADMPCHEHMDNASEAAQDEKSIPTQYTARQCVQACMLSASCLVP
jgi:hypothetical protein